MARFGLVPALQIGLKLLDAASERGISRRSSCGSYGRGPCDDLPRDFLHDFLDCSQYSEIKYRKERLFPEGQCQDLGVLVVEGNHRQGIQ